MWTYQHSLETAADVAAIWRLYRDTTVWPHWNGAVDRVELDGPFRSGAIGGLTPAGAAGPLPFRIVTAVEDQGYTSETEIADTVTLRLTNTLTPLPDGGTRVTHRADLVGPAAEFFGTGFGPRLTEGVPKSMAALTALALSEVSLSEAAASEPEPAWPDRSGGVAGQ